MGSICYKVSVTFKNLLGVPIRKFGGRPPSMEFSSAVCGLTWWGWEGMRWSRFEKWIEIRWNWLQDVKQHQIILYIYIWASIPRHPPPSPHPMVMGLYSSALVPPTPPVVWVVVGGSGGGRSCICMYMYVFVCICIWLYDMYMIVCICICMCMYVYVCVCVYEYVYYVYVCGLCILCICM